MNRPPCYPSSGHERTWRSTGGILICGLCHPPATEALVAEWIDAGQELEADADLLDGVMLEDWEETAGPARPLARAVDRAESREGDTRG